MYKLIFSVVLFAGLTASAAGAQPTTADRPKIEAAFEQVIAAAVRGDAEAYLTYFDDEVILAEMVPGQTPVIGKHALRPWITDFLKNNKFAWTDYKSEEVLVFGNLAFHRYTGVASFAPKSGGETVRLPRRYIDILRRDSKGDWKIWHHVWTAASDK